MNNDILLSVHHVHARQNVFRHLEVLERGLSDTEIEAILNDELRLWGVDTAMLAPFIDNLEAGNIDMGGDEVTKWRVRRRNINKLDFKTLDDLPTTEEGVVSFIDFTPQSDTTYEYAVYPVSETDVMGRPVRSTITPEFTGWWLVDQDDTSNYIQFQYNLSNVNIRTEEDRVELSTFAKYPLVRYGEQRVRRGTLTGLFIPEGETALSQYNRLDSLLAKHTPLLLKDGRGINYIVNVHSPQEIVSVRPSGLSNVTIQWVEVGEYDD